MLSGPLRSIYRRRTRSSDETALSTMASAGPQITPHRGSIVLEPGRWWRPASDSFPSSSSSSAAAATNQQSNTSRRSSDHNQYHRRYRQQEDDLSPAAKDALYCYQVRRIPAPHTALTPSSLVVAGVTSSTSDAATVHDVLVRSGILTSGEHIPSTTALLSGGARRGSGSDGGGFGGAGIIPRLTRGTLNVEGMRNLVKTLFFWEGEVVRLRRLADEQVELEGLIASLREPPARPEELREPPPQQPSGDGNDVGANDSATNDNANIDGTEQMVRELELRLRAVRMRLAARPSVRSVEDGGVIGGVGEPLPKYEELGGRV